MEQLIAGFANLDLMLLVYCLMGSLLGLLVGVLPGMGTAPALALLVPLTFGMEFTQAIVMVCSCYYGVQYGAAIPAICLNVPGAPSTAVTCIDGHKLAKKNRTGEAIFIAAITSMVGGLFGVVLLAVLTPILSIVAIKFGPSEYFFIFLLAMVMTALVQSQDVIKNFTMLSLGAMLGFLGIDVNSGVHRFTFGSIQLLDGFTITVLLTGLFGLGEVLYSLDKKIVHHSVKMSKLLPSMSEIRKVLMPTLRGSGIGSLFGTLPATGATLATLIAWLTEKKLDKNNEIGTGAVEGVAAPESANNAAAQTSLVPTLSMGIPGDPIMVILLSVFMMHGVIPGPNYVQSNQDFFWTLVACFVIVNFICMCLNISMLRIWIRITKIPYHYIFASVVVFSSMGVYAANNNPYEVYMLLIFGILGYVLKRLNFSIINLIIGFVFGPMLELHLRRGLMMYDYNLAEFAGRPVAIGVLVLISLIILFKLKKFTHKSRHS